MTREELRTTLLDIIDAASRDLMSGYTDHDSYVAHQAVQAIGNAVWTVIPLTAQSPSGDSQ